MLKKTRTNEQIREDKVRLVSNDGSQIGVITIEEALRYAEKEGLDLVEVAPDANPVVCRVMDFSKYMYEQKKKARENKKNQKIVHVKEIKMRPTISEHDYQFKFRHLCRFINSGDKTKISIKFKGRSIGHPELGRKVLERIIKEASEFTVTEQMPTMERQDMSIILAPKKVK
ncbi:MAG: translation initiation factor IF-3 [bacterium]|nr:translation initiation factor IF-3 [bacterium]